MIMMAGQAKSACARAKKNNFVSNAICVFLDLEESLLWHYTAFCISSSGRVSLETGRRTANAADSACL